MSSSMMLFDGIPEAKRQRFSSLAMEAPLSSTSTSGGSSGLDFRDGSVGISEDRRVKSVLGQCEHHDTDLRKLLFNRWKQSFNCEVGIFVRCSASKKDFMEEFRGLPVTYYPDGLALVRIHGVVGSMSPLLASMQQAARRRVRVEKNAEESRKRRRTEDVAADLTTGESVGSASSVNSENGTGKPDGVPAGTSLMIPNLEARLKSGSLNLLEEGLIFFSLDISVIEGCAFIRAVNYLYTGTLRLCDVTISETLRACRFLGLQGGIDLCVNYLLEKLQPCNALSICALGNLFNCGTLEEMADEYLSDHFMEVTNDVEWRELAFDAVQRLLSRDNLKCDSEASVVRALYQWASYNRTNETHPRLSQVLESDFTKPDPSPSSPTHTDSNQSGSTSSRNPDQAEISKEERKNKDDKDIEVEDRGAEADDEDDDEDDDVNDDDDDDEDEDDDDIDDDDDDEEENREEAFAKMLSDGSIRFAHLSDDEITMLTEEIQQASPALHELWLQAVDKERLKRDKRQEKVKRTMQKDTKMASNDCDAGEEEDEEVEDMDDEDDDERSVPNLRRYNTAAGCQVEGASCVATLEGHGGYVYAVSELKDGSLVSGSRDQTIRVWDMKENCMATFDRSDGTGPQPLILEKHSDRVFGLVVLSSGKLASCSFDQTICIWNTSNWECEKVLSGHEGWVVAIAECCGKLVSGAADNLLKVWDVESGTCIKTLEGHSDHVYGVCAIADVESGRPLLASGSQDCTVKLWDPQQDWKELRTLKGHKGSIRSIKQCGRYLASASADRTIRLWMCTGKSLGKAAGKLIGHSDVVESLASISLAGAHHPVLASASRDNSIKIWNTLTKCCIRTLVGHRNWVKSLFYLSNGRLASASADGTVRVWDLQSH